MSDELSNTLRLTRRGVFSGGVAGLVVANAAIGTTALARAIPAACLDSAQLDRRFLPGSIDAATRRVNRILESESADMNVLSHVSEIRKLWNSGPQWSPDLVAAGTPGLKLMPMPPRSAVEEKRIEGPSPQGIRLLTLRPPGISRGTYFYVHGGGWIAQSPDDYLSFLWRLCREAEVAVVAPDYRLAPEHPFPAGPDDALAAARWLVTSGSKEFKGPFIMGGDSAGGHLAALTLQRLRDEARLTPFVGADLVYGCYDMTLTPSARAHGDKLPLSTSMMKVVADWACGNLDKNDSKVSPLYGSVDGLPPALFTVGTSDPLLDDTLFMNQHWRAAGRPAVLEVYPGGVHGFDWLPLAIGVQSIDRRVQFLRERVRSA
jgi:acetyl esterase/lipase